MTAPSEINSTVCTDGPCFRAVRESAIELFYRDRSTGWQNCYLFTNGFFRNPDAALCP